MYRIFVMFRAVLASWYQIFVIYPKSFFLTIKHLLLARRLYRKLGITSQDIKNLYILVGEHHLEFLPNGGFFIRDTHRLFDIFPKILAIDYDKNSLKELQLILAPTLCPVETLLLTNTNNLSLDKLKLAMKLHSIALPFVLDEIANLDSLSVLLQNAKSLLYDGGIVFGLTVVGKNIANKKSYAKYIKEQNEKNHKKWFNLDRSAEELYSIFNQHFENVVIDIHGAVIFFQLFNNQPEKDFNKIRLTLDNVGNKYLEIPKNNSF